MTGYDTALDAALNKVAPDGDSYVRGETIFWDTLNQNAGYELADDKAIQHALLETMADEADFEQYWEAYMTFWSIMESFDSSTSLRDKIMGLTSRGKAKVSHDTSGKRKRSYRLF